MRFTPLPNHFENLPKEIGIRKTFFEELLKGFAEQRNKTARKNVVNVCLWKSSAMCFIPCEFMMINRQWNVVRKCWGWYTYLLPSLGGSICPEAFWESSDNTVKAAWAHAAATLGPTAQARKETWWNFPTVDLQESNRVENKITFVYNESNRLSEGTKIKESITLKHAVPLLQWAPF